MSDWILSFPDALYLQIVLLPILVVFWMLYRHRQKAMNLLGPKSGAVRSGTLFLLYVIALGLSWALAVFALAGPKKLENSIENGATNLKSTFKEQPGVGEETVKVQLTRKAHDLIVLLDTSASMGVTDTAPGISRLEYAKEIADEVVLTLNGEMVTLYAFTSQLTPLVPSTYDILFFRMILKKVRVNEGDVAGTDIAEALDELAAASYHQKEGKKTTLLIFTDGEDVNLMAPSEEGRKRDLEAIISRIDKLKGFRVYIVGMGTKAGKEIPGLEYEGKPVVSHLDEELLRELAEAGGGRFYLANDHTALTLAQALKENLGPDDTYVEEKELKIRQGTIQESSADSRQYSYKEYFQWPLWGAFICLCLALLLPEQRKILSFLFLLSFVVPLKASGAEEERAKLWQKGEAFYHQENYLGSEVAFGRLLNYPLNSLESAAVQFNISQTLIEQKKWAVAASLLEKLTFEKDAPPQLQEERRRRLSYILLQQAQELYEKQLFKEALASLNKALKYTQGDELLFARQLQENIKESFETLKLADDSWQQLTKGLIAELKRSIPELELMIPLESSQEQWDFVLSQQPASNLRFPLLKKAIEKLPPEQKETQDKIKPLFEEAERAYKEGEEFLQEGNGASALTSWKEALEALEKMIKEESKDSSDKKQENTSQQQEQEQQKEQEEQQEQQEQNKSSEEQEQGKTSEENTPQEAEENKPEGEQEKKEEQLRSLLQNLEQMEQNDAPLLEKPVSAPKQGTRPW